MKNSQLEMEFANMKDRHELYAKFGIAAEAAQLFETELGTLLLALRGLEHNWHCGSDAAAAQKSLDFINKSTVGAVLSELKRGATIEDDVLDTFSSALEARNRLTHGFFERHNFKIQAEVGRHQKIADLDTLHGRLFAGWQVASKLSTAIVAMLIQERNS